MFYFAIDDVSYFADFSERRNDTLSKQSDINNRTNPIGCGVNNTINSTVRNFVSNFNNIDCMKL
jgi:hypothetical protein